MKYMKYQLYLSYIILSFQIKYNFKTTMSISIEHIVAVNARPSCYICKEEKFLIQEYVIVSTHVHT